MRNFTIKKSFLVPLGLLLALSVALFVVCLVREQPPAKIIILGILIIPVAALFVESAFRRTVIGEEGITVHKFLREKNFSFSEITAVETVQVRKRVFLTLCAGEDFLILSNAYAGFPALVSLLLERVPPGTVSEETRKMAEAPPMKSTDVLSCWLAVALLAFILYLQLGGDF
jgi:hypothetical protein